MWKLVLRAFDPSTSNPAPNPATDDPTTTDEGHEKLSGAIGGDGDVDSSDAPSTTPSASAFSVPPVFSLPSNALHLYHQIERQENQGTVPLPLPGEVSFLTGPEEVNPVKTMLEASASSTPKLDEDRTAALVAAAIHGTFMPSSMIETNETGTQSTTAPVNVFSASPPLRRLPSYIDESTLKTMFGLARMIVAATSLSGNTREQQQDVREEMNDSFSSSSSSFSLIGLHDSAQSFSEGWLDDWEDEGESEWDCDCKNSDDGNAGANEDAASPIMMTYTPDHDMSTDVLLHWTPDQNKNMHMRCFSLQQATLRDTSPGSAGIQEDENEEIKLDPDLESEFQVLDHTQDGPPQHVSECALSPLPFFRIIEDGEFELEEM
ncbi:hypothetical protein EW145_g5377 [Phellinidium pouzarii]|uniref:Uncharacterized protein n=1 Tax=Phellinidium pouzarii TaxID=167371 RepID=A0A4S4L061_9AGAM|nr:hypothetical protein EW145_g5377 [Phellinidium pouzarii]